MIEAAAWQVKSSCKNTFPSLGSTKRGGWLIGTGIGRGDVEKNQGPMGGGKGTWGTLEIFLGVTNRKKKPQLDL